MRQTPEQDAFALSLGLRLVGMPVDPRQIYHFLGRPAAIGEVDILRAAKAMGARARAHKTAVSRLQETPLPALAFFKDKGWVVIGKVTPVLAIVQGGGDISPKTLSLAEFTEAWNGRIILLSKRLAIARALVSDPRILIFDEATSALDYESESIIHRNMRKIVEGRTVFIIAHRLSAVRLADRILTIEDEVVTEDGCHDELAAANGRYATLLRLQSGLA